MNLVDGDPEFESLVRLRAAEANAAHGHQAEYRAALDVTDPVFRAVVRATEAMSPVPPIKAGKVRLLIEIKDSGRGGTVECAAPPDDPR